MTFESPVTLALDARRIPYKTFTHAGPVRSLEQAAAERGQRPEQIVRSLVFRVQKGEYVMVLVAGPAQVSWPELRQYLRTRRITTAKREELLATTGYEIGAVSPFGLPMPMRILLDRTVLVEETLSLGSGVRGTTIILQRDDLLHGLGDVEHVDLTTDAQGQL
jgi:Cys-tRNA(Pro) deacylase